MRITVNGKSVATGETWAAAYGKTIKISEFDVRWDKIDDAILDSNGVSKQERKRLEDQYTIACGMVTDTQHGETFTYDGAVYVDELSTRKGTE